MADRKITRVLFQLLLLTSTLFLAQNLNCNVQAETKDPLVSVKTLPSVNLSLVFKELDLTGSTIIYDAKNDRVYEHNPDRNIKAVSPASTFKIFNALVALEIATIADDVSVLTWDGVKRRLPNGTELPAWNRDTNLRQAFKDSTIWFYQVLARRTGRDRMQQFLNQSNYGNHLIGSQIDQFWLDGSLKITPRQQIEFLRKLDREELPFSKRTLALVKDIMILEKTPDYVLRGKTGWNFETNLGWFVGYLEQNDRTYFFATTIDMTDSKSGPKRIEVTRRCLKKLGLL